MSNTVHEFKPRPVDIAEVRERGGLSLEDAKLCSDLANEIFKKAIANEPAITKDIVSTVDKVGTHLYGLDNRLKQPTSLAAKIGADAISDNIDYSTSSKSIKDAIRYTSISNDDNFTNGYFSIKKILESKGYKEIRCKNYFSLYKQGKAQHKAVQCVYKDPYGNVFEFQFQTYSSQAAKELKIPLYEERRKQTISEQRKNELERQMRDLAECVPYPPDVFKI